MPENETESFEKHLAPPCYKEMCVQISFCWHKMDTIHRQKDHKNNVYLSLHNITNYLVIVFTIVFNDNYFALIYYMENIVLKAKFSR